MDLVADAVIVAGGNHSGLVGSRVENQGVVAIIGRANAPAIGVQALDHGSPVDDGVSGVKFRSHKIGHARLELEAIRPLVEGGVINHHARLLGRGLGQQDGARRSVCNRIDRPQRQERRGAANGFGGGVGDSGLRRQGLHGVGNGLVGNLLDEEVAALDFAPMLGDGAEAALLQGRAGSPGLEGHAHPDGEVAES